MKNLIYNLHKIAGNVQLINSILEEDQLKDFNNEQHGKFAQLHNSTLKLMRETSHDYLIKKGRLKRAAKLKSSKTYIEEIVKICDVTLLELKRETKATFKNELIKMF